MNAAPVGVEADAAGPRPRYVLPGQVFASAEPTRFTTILGSCVAVCLYDAGRGVGGLNHYLLPGVPVNPEEREPLRWGEPAIAKLLDLMLAAGARRSCLQAKVFGGAQISARSVPDAMRIGERNIETALAALARLQIPVMNQSLGGAAGRKIIFESHSGMVWAKILGRTDLKSGAAPPTE